jgi:hypothetical protein
MSLNFILNNYILCKRIMGMLNEGDKCRLSLVNKGINVSMNKEGYFENINYKNDNIEKYMEFLEMYDRHKRYIKVININKYIGNINEYLPMNTNNRLVLKLDNSKLNNEDITKLLKRFKIDIKDCYIDKVYNKNVLLGIQSPSLVKSHTNKIYV